MSCYVAQIKEILPRICLEEYIPFKIIIDRKKEEINHIYFSKEATSCLEIAIGNRSRAIHRITLLLSEEYEIVDEYLKVDSYAERELYLEDISNKECVYFMTRVYANGIQVKVSEKKGTAYVKMGKLYIGLHENREIVEILFLPLNYLEVEHIRKELELQ